VTETWIETPEELLVYLRAILETDDLAGVAEHPEGGWVVFTRLKTAAIAPAPRRS